MVRLADGTGRRSVVATCKSGTPVDGLMRRSRMSLDFQETLKMDQDEYGFCTANPGTSPSSILLRVQSHSSCGTQRREADQRVGGRISHSPHRAMAQTVDANVPTSAFRVQDRMA